MKFPFTVTLPNTPEIRNLLRGNWISTEHHSNILSPHKLKVLDLYHGIYTVRDSIGTMWAINAEWFDRFTKPHKTLNELVV